LITREHIRDWLVRLDAAVEADFHASRGVADEIQRRSRPGLLHLAATQCRIASVQAAASRTTEDRRIQARHAIRVLQRTLENMMLAA
jgi:hypothetical protein